MNKKPPEHKPNFETNDPEWGTDFGPPISKRKRLLWATACIVFVLGFLAPLLLIPAAITVAILKYRLFEIDRLISRTLGYALVLTGLGAVYAVGSVWLPAHLVGERPPPFVAGSTLVVAALFNPVRRRALVWVDRRFYRSQYDAQRVIDRFGELLRDELDVGQLRSESMEAVVATMQPVSVSVWLPDRTAR